MDTDTVESLQTERLALQKELLAAYWLLKSTVGISLRALLTRDVPVSLMEQQSFWQHIREVEDLVDIEIEWEDDSGELKDDGTPSLFSRIADLHSSIHPRSAG